MPQNPVRWVLTILFLTLIGLTAWIAWAMGKLEEKRAAKRAKEQTTTAPPAAVETPNSNSSNPKE